MSPAGSAPYPLSPLIRPPEEHGYCWWAALDLGFHTVLSAVSQMSLERSCLFHGGGKTSPLDKWNLVFT